MTDEIPYPSPRFALAYPIAPFVGAFLLCMACLHGGDLLADAPTQGLVASAADPSG